MHTGKWIMVPPIVYHPSTWAVVFLFASACSGVMVHLLDWYLQRAMRGHQQVARHRAGFGNLAVGLRKLNDALAARSGLSARWILRLEIGILLSVAGIMLALELYALTIAGWILFALLAAAKAFEWHGITGQRTITTVLRAAWIGGSFIACIVLVTATNLKRDGAGWWPKSCATTVNVTSEIVARVHLRATWHPKGTGQETDVYGPLFQDLFHEWTIEVTPNKETSEIVISIRDARLPNDTMRVNPTESAVISSPKPGWVSGFDEPTQVPDFFLRTVKFSRLRRPATITIRKPIKSEFVENTITSIDLDLDREVRASASRCQIMVVSPPTSARPLSDTSRFRDLTKELHAMLTETVAGKPGPTTRLDPDARPRKERALIDMKQPDTLKMVLPKVEGSVPQDGYSDRTSSPALPSSALPTRNTIWSSNDFALAVAEP